jgi:hypothetical protein
MHSISKLKHWASNSPGYGAIAAFCITAVMGIAARPLALDRLLTNMQPAFDGNIYYLIALHGYQHALTDQSLAGLPAFYPMWPLVLRFFWTITGTVGSVAVASALSFACFLTSVLLLERGLRHLVPAGIQKFALLAFVLSPTSVFHATLYSESWFGLICALWLLAILRCFERMDGRNLILLTIATSILSLSRPILLQAIAAIVAVWAVELFRGRNHPRDTESHKLFLVTSAIVTGLCIGYLPYGLHNLQLFGDFLHPFQLQSLWGRSLSLNWQLIFAPKAVSGSIHVLIWDMVAFYLPIYLLIGSSIGFLRPNHGMNSGQRFLLWFGIFFAGAHAAIAFLTYPIFMSLGRHNLASPLLYVALAVYLSQAKINRRAQLIFLLVCAAHSIHFWARFARGAWMG